jgi:hypothetical protein
MFLKMARDLIDPRTRQATAFYAAVAVAVYDILRQGFHMLNTIVLASAAGLTVAGALAALVKIKPPDPPESV